MALLYVILYIIINLFNYVLQQCFCFVLFGVDFNLTSFCRGSSMAINVSSKCTAFVSLLDIILLTTQYVTTIGEPVNASMKRICICSL